METKNKPCQKCQQEPCEPGLRFCAGCAANLRREMASTGYLQEDDPEPKQERASRAPNEQWREAWSNYVGGAGAMSEESPPDRGDDEDGILEKF